MPTLPPDTSLTLRDLILRVAEECGLAYYDSSSPDALAGIPRDRQVLDKITRAVNDGMDRLARDYPKWSCLRPQVSFALSPSGTSPLSVPNVMGENDGTVYRLPWYIHGRPIDGWTWTSTESNFSGRARDATPEQVDLAHRSASSTSYPQMASMIVSPQRGDAGADRQMRAVRFWPVPDQAYLMTARFPVAATKMTGLDDRHIFGATHDQTVLAYAMQAMKEHDAKDASMRATYQERADRALAASIRIDMESVPRTLGPMHDPGVGMGSQRYVSPGVDVVTSSMTSVLA